MSLQVLLVCGTGASSGFMAVSMRKVAKKKGLDYQIKARSESELENYLAETDVIMIGPHLSFMEAEIKQLVTGTDKKVILMNSDYYATLDGEKALDHLQSVLD
ncbi:PTS sugar transporter subunit IIB [Companilactobacillus sp. HBUAS56275]|jgi:Phosphotransferase system cellobiose-specific component IIB|uniref:PTS sugar transporter subunit IIB n=1 Tax=Candidatus Companilactobacillus pullicola TaxID=2838523 RepID=A0A9D1ZNU9_9LACO|nr:PTS sugar transporter subunit IIB [Candidatus Companilactobacillus pullicola]